VRDSVEPRQLNRFQQLNSAKIQGVVKPWITLDTAITYMENEARKLMPPGFSFDYSGTSRQLRTEGNAFWLTMGLALVLIYLVLSAQFESFRDPLIVLLGSVPLAICAASVVLFLGIKGATVNIYTQVGLITLVGLIAKNGILIVEFANKLMEEKGLSKVEAALEAATTRLRPVLMTTVATVIGHLPLVFVTGAGAVARNHIGIVLVTGMAIGTAFTLFILPSIYVLLADGKRALKFQRPDNSPADDDDEMGILPARNGHQIPSEPVLAK
jgi:multidrug efflux pump